MRSGKRFEGVPFWRLPVQFRVQYHVRFSMSDVQSPISCTTLCTIYSVHVHFSFHHMFEFCTCTFLDRLFCTCTKSYVQKIVTNVQNLVQNSALIRTFFHDICTSRGGTPDSTSRCDYSRGSFQNATEFPKKEEFGCSRIALANTRGLLNRSLGPFLTLAAH